MESPHFKNKKQTKKTQPIPIPVKYEKQEIKNHDNQNDENDFLKEVEEKQNFFDPTKPSPPNSWTTRLEKRMHNYYLEKNN